MIRRLRVNRRPRQQVYYCFACGAGGDVFDFPGRGGPVLFADGAQRPGTRLGITTFASEAGLTTTMLAGSGRRRLMDRHLVALPLPTSLNSSPISPPQPRRLPPHIPVN